MAPTPPSPTSTTTPRAGDTGGGPTGGPWSNAQKVKRALSYLFYDRTIVALTGMFAIGIVCLLAYLSHFSTNLVRAATLQEASGYADAIETFRTLYTSEVVVRAAEYGLNVAHDYAANKGTIPLPATLSILFGERISHSAKGTRVQLLSRYPFPLRAKGRTLDKFQKAALIALEENPKKPFYRFDTIDGVPTIRYARADIMRAECVGCHNSHPESSKRDWRAGDVVGMITIDQPMQAIINETHQGIRGVFLLAAFLSTLALVALALVVKRLRLEARDATSLLEKSEETNRVLQIEIAERKHAQEERHKIEVQMQRAQKLESLGVLAGGIAHDFNNLLMGILGNAGLALMKLASDSPLRKRVEQIRTAAERAAELTNQLLAYSGKGKLAIEQIDITNLVEEMRSLLDTIISKKARLTYEGEEDLPLVDGDATQIRQVVMNLITNASDALGENNGEITVCTKTAKIDKANQPPMLFDKSLTPGKYICLEVSDNGAGMDRATISKIFDPFFSTKVTGRGLGLAAALGIVHGHHGGLLVRSTPGKGTTFQVYLPVSATAASSTSIAVEEGQGTRIGRGHILVVDDEKACLDVTKEILEHHNYIVLTAEDGAQALNILHKNSSIITAVLLDMNMPKMDGESTFRELRDRHQAIPVIFMSGYNEAPMQEDGTKRPHSGFLQKPFRPEALVQLLEKLLAKPGKNSEDPPQTIGS